MFALKLSNISSAQNQCFDCRSRDYDSELDDIDALLADICECLSEKNLVEFSITGFDLNWPVDVRFDLPIVIAQIPHAIAALENQADTNLQLYEQGIERELSFKITDLTVEIECKSLTGDLLTNAKEHINRVEVLAMLKDFLERFLRLSYNMCPEITSHMIFVDWLKNIK